MKRQDGPCGWLVAVCAGVGVLVGAMPAPSEVQACDITVEAMRSERRVALVIGNAAYKASPLRNPVNDARSMARALREVGFEVLAVENLTEKDFCPADQCWNSAVGLGWVNGSRGKPCRTPRIGHSQGLVTEKLASKRKG